MYLVTLGRTALSGSSFRRQKPLLLLAYLTLEGPRSRRYLAELFWPGATDNLNSLSVALSQIRRGTELSLGSDDQHVWVVLESDAADLRAALRSLDLDRALQLYGGPFLDGAGSDLGEELEEWLYATREHLAAELRAAMLREAEAQAGVGRFADAAGMAEKAWQLPGAPEPEPEELPRFHRLFAAGDSALAADVEQAASEFGLELLQDSGQARAQLRQPVLGRDHELASLRQLPAGSWAWLQGAAGMGKTTLLRAVGGTYLPARSGLPYATLEPLLHDQTESDPAWLRKHLRQLAGTWLIDDWERMDEASRTLLLSLRELHIQSRVVIASSTQPAFPVELSLVVGPLSQDALRTLSQGWERTGGLPPLVAAELNRQSPEAALEAIILELSDETRQFLFGISLLEQADPVVVRRALRLPAAVTAASLESLRLSGLLDATGQVRAVDSLRELLKRQPATQAAVALQLARELPVTESYRLWLLSRALWEDSDLAHVVAAILHQAAQLIGRGFPLAAAKVLGQAPPSAAVELMRARALERAGHYREALAALQGADDGPTAAAVRAAALLRLGQTDEAREAATSALAGSLEDRAWGQNTLGLLDFAAGDPDGAARAFRRTAALWRATGQTTRLADTLNNLAVVSSELGQNSMPLFNEALQLADGNAAVLSRVKLNLARVLERLDDPAGAQAALEEAGTLSRESGDVATAARIFNNLGALKHRQGELAAAGEAYRQALELAGQGGEQRLLAVTLANLAELELDFEAWQEAVRLFSQAGFDPQELIAELPANHPFRERSGDPP